MKPNDKAYAAAIKIYNIHSDYDAEAVSLRLAVDAAFAAQFQSEDYAGLVEELREDVLQFNLKDTVYENIAKEAADILEALLAEREELKAERDAANKRAANRLAVEAERDALLARLAPVDDEELVEIAADAISKQVPDRDVQWGDVRDAAIDAIAAIRPHIEAAEREQCAKAVEKVAERINVAHHERPEWEDGYLQGVHDAAAAIRSRK